MRVNVVCDYEWKSEYGRRFQLKEPAIFLSTHPRFGNVYFRPEAVSASLGFPLDPLSLDLCEIASYVYMADKAFSRGPEEKWTRDFSFLVPVSNPDRWNSVKELLINTVGTLSGDNFSFHFVSKYSNTVATRTRGAKIIQQGVDSDCVSLFSGGLDSFCGAAYLIKDGRRPLFASHYVSVLKSLQQGLLSAIEREYGCAFRHLQYRVTSANGGKTRFPLKSRESSHRARSFLFMSFAAAAAAVCGLHDIFICENGVLSLNVPISEARKGTRSTRHAHPLYLCCFNELIDSLYSRTFSVKNPFMFWTKAEEVQLIAATGLSSQIKNTVTCWGYPNQTLSHKDSNHCGYCIPCLVRRVSLISAGVESYDDRYIVDVFSPNGSSSGKHLRNIEDLVYFCETFLGFSRTELLYKYPELVMVEVVRNGSADGEDNTAKILRVYKSFAEDLLSTVTKRKPSMLNQLLPT